MNKKQGQGGGQLTENRRKKQEMAMAARNKTKNIVDDGRGKGGKK